MTRWALAIGLAVAAVGGGCDQADVQETASLYYPELSDAAQVAKADELARVMPFYVTGTCLALLLMGVAAMNAMEHARNLGQAEALRFGAYVMLLCFVGLFLAMSAQREWIPVGHPIPAFSVSAGLSALSIALAARASPERAILVVGYLSMTLALPLFGLLLSSEVRLVDTTASLFIGFATGLLAAIVISDPVRGGLVTFLGRRDSA